MRAAGALALALAACAVLPAHAAQGRSLNQVPERQRAGVLDPSTAAEEPILTTAISVGEETTACQTFSPYTLEWGYSRSAVDYGANGTSQPDLSDVQALIARICRSPAAAGSRIMSAVQAGGPEAQSAVYALLNADCPDVLDAGSETYSAAIDAVTSGDPADLPAVAEWFTNLAEAADAVGIPLCASAAVIDPTTGELLQEEFFHTGAAGPAESPQGADGAAILTTSISFVDTVSCDVFDPDLFTWVTNYTAEPLVATNTTKPPASLVGAVMDQICSDPVTAGDQLLAAVQAGGQEAQVWVDALLTADCLENPSSPNDAYQQAINTLNPEGDPTDLPAVASWFSNMAAAADAVGTPVCLSLAVVNEGTGEVLEKRDFFTGDTAA
ncbi:hypothetical protein CHLNCDRAFT_137132 [Chlorella variabilis]|uniref:Uncharacterized protein n=1 Tax=Chlorella variabilis TaxID=554065 RepID=E1ZLA9_CHLVA|nr:hypothetical protein CHLNCDRAFT_137132 [Chlorella variabilis]EFN53370.1 hypothetical protein CHLNCDRAFT_137132 [Chlorella variabilis]|eukprot:XP_005845472.1 hypothetical protein CHLNCDRAFT_137132 [Chlorella variabilis]